MGTVTEHAEDVIESTFSHVKDKISRMNKNERASPYTVWMYCQTSKYARQGGLDQAISPPHSASHVSTLILISIYFHDRHISQQAASA